MSHRSGHSPLSTGWVSRGAEIDLTVPARLFDLKKSSSRNDRLHAPLRRATPGSRRKRTMLTPESDAMTVDIRSALEVVDRSAEIRNHATVVSRRTTGPPTCGT